MAGSFSAPIPALAAAVAALRKAQGKRNPNDFSVGSRAAKAEKRTS
jgi:hypothetical protein